MKRLGSVLVVYALLAFSGAMIDACTPQQRAAIPVAERALCVMLRASGDPDAAAICATADELAPFVAELLAAHDDHDAAAPLFAFALPAPRRAAPRRRCASWIVLDAGPAEAGP